jgi:hypothetical protein
MTTSKTSYRAAAVLAACAVIFPLGGFAQANASTKATGIYKNCTAFNHKYPHGVGKNNAHDHHTKTSKAVTNFKHSTTIYNTAMSHNKGLDRDKDGIACEKH